MRKINLANDKKRDAQIGFELNRPKDSCHYRTISGKTVSSGRFLRYSEKTVSEKLFAQHPDFAESLINGDPEIEMELAGKELEDLTKVYLSPDDKVVYSACLMENIYAPDGSKKDSKEAVSLLANIADETLPLRWTGKMFPKEQALRKFVFGRTYQLRHVNGLTFDFLYEMAKKLNDSNSMMLVGGGEKGNSPLVMTNNGTPYRGFLEGRIRGESYCLLLHLTNLELKGI